MQGVNQYRSEVGAINIVYKSLQEDRDAADISHIIQELHEVIEPAIEIRSGTPADARIYDISQIDFDRLRREFEKRVTKKTDVQNLKDAIEKRLAILLAQNPLRANFQQRYEEIVSAYNSEKDRVTIETTFEALLRLVAGLDEESARAIREGLDEESLALFDLLKKPDLRKNEIERIKKVAIGLLALLKKKKQEIEDWRAKENTRDDMRQGILDFLYSDSTGLPESYGDEEITARTDAVYQFAYRALS
jgi:type I restriction enzyme R subunit